MPVLTEAQRLKLKNHLTADPNAKGYAEDVAAGRIGLICVKLNERNRSTARLRKITTLEIMNECWAQSKGIFDKLNAAEPQDSRVKEALVYLRSAGLDINNLKTQEMFALLGFTTEEADALKAMAVQAASEMEILELPTATDEVVWEAIGE